MPRSKPSRKKQTARKQAGLSKAPTGIEGVDQIMGGGLPRGGSTLVIGTAGSGKTIFALQTLVNGARLFGEPAICVAFEESTQQIVTNTESFGWEMKRLTSPRRRGGPAVTLISGQLSAESVHAGQFDLHGVLAMVEHTVKETGARRVAFDGIDVLLGLLPDQRTQRQEMYRIRELLERTGLTGIVTASMVVPELLEGFMLSLSDCVIQLSNRLVDRVAVRSFRVLKYRGSSFVANEVPLAITDTGMEVANFGFAPNYPVSRQRISTGIPRLDAMLAGGYFRGSSVLVSGPPGSAKTTLAGALVAAACARGERALYVSLDEHPNQVIRNLASVGIKLEPCVRSGLLHMYSDLSQATSPEDQFIRVRRHIREFRPRVLVIDPISAIMTMGGSSNALGLAQRLLELGKAESITTIWTTLNNRTDDTLASAQLPVSSVADTWISLANRAGRGERNRTLTIMKSRGTGHSNQIREMILSDQGVDLADVYTADGGGLMGTARRAQESADTAAARRAAATSRRKGRELEDEATETRSQIEALVRKLARLSTENAVAETTSGTVPPGAKPRRRRKNKRRA